MPDPLGLVERVALLPQPRTASVTALEPTLVLRPDKGRTRRSPRH